MNICLIMPNVFPVPATKGGATEMLITKLLQENEKKGLIRFTCISVYEKEAQILSQKYQYTDFVYIKQKRDNLDLTFEKEDSSFKQYMDEIYQQIKDIKFDFIIIEGGEISGYKYLLERFPKEKCIVHIHGNGLGNSKINNQIYKKYIAISEYTRKLLIQEGNVEDNRIELLYNAIQLQEFDKKISEKEKQALRKSYGISIDDTVILYSGRTIPQKGVKELITAFKKLKNIKKCKLLIVGSGNYGEKVKTPFDYELEELAKDVQDKIKFTGYIENKDLYKIHNISDIAVVPSIWEELFGLVVVESMSSGLPLIVTKSGGIPEIVDEKCAFILEKDDKLIKNLAKKIDFLTENPEIRREMGSYGKERAKKYGMEKYLINFYNLIKKLQNENKNMEE